MSSELLSVYFGKRAEPGTVRPHSHSFWQMEIVTHGVLHCSIGGQQHVLETGDSLLVPPGWEHAFQYDKPGIAWITLKFERSGDDQPDLGGVIRGSQVMDRLIASFKTMIRGSVLKEYEKTYVHGFLETVYCYMRSDDAVKAGEPPSALLARITDKVLAKSGRTVTVNELADELGYTRSHLSRKFKELTGENLKSYIDKIRLEKVEELLRYREFSISDIAADLGFSDIFSFSRFFKKHTGMRPRDFK